MPATPKGPHLWFRKPRRDKQSGKILGKATWIIIDGAKHIATGCFAGEDQRAQEFLAKYITEKYRPDKSERALDQIDVADVLTVYVDAGKQSGPKFAGRMARLADFFGELKLSQINGVRCRTYAKLRGDGGARRDLQDLAAAINFHAGEGYHRGVVKVPLPKKGEPRDRWLTKEEAIKALRTCLHTREVQTHSKGEVTTAKYPLRHLARFLLIGWYTGTRATAIATASPVKKEGRSWVDLERGIFYRRAIGKQETNKRQPAAPIPARLLSHMRRWVRLGLVGDCFVEFNGKPIKSVKTAFKSMCAKAGIEPASPHALRHTAATWMMQEGASTWKVAGYLGMSEPVLIKVYGHHHPDYMDEAVDAANRRPNQSKKREALVVSLVERVEHKKAGG